MITSENEWYPKENSFNRKEDLEEKRDIELRAEGRP